MIDIYLEEVKERWVKRRKELEEEEEKKRVEKEKKKEREWRRQELENKRRKEKRKRVIVERQCFMCRIFRYMARYCRNKREEGLA